MQRLRQRPTVAPETEVAPSPAAAAYAALATEKKRLVWAALEGGHPYMHKANETLADINAEALLLEEEQEARRRPKRRPSATSADEESDVLLTLSTS